MLTLILIAYHFPPETAIGAARPYRFFKYLRRLGYTVHVLTASPQPADADKNIQYIPDPFFSPMRDAGWQIERAIRKFLLPGVLGLRWAHAVSSAAQRYLSQHPGPAVVLSTCPPFGTHYAGWRLSKAASLAWIADFRDPLGGVSMAMEGLNSFQKLLFNWLEKKVIRSASLTIANTDAMAEEWKRQHPLQATRIHLLWNGFDPEAYIAPKDIPARPYKVLSHVGELYAGRTVTPLLESFGRLVDSARVSPHSFNVRIIGPAKPSAIPNEEFLSWGRSQGWLDLSTQPVKQHEAREIAQTSDGLLLIQPQSAVQVPGKLYEYLQIGRPILAFVMRDSPVERILSRSGVAYRCVYVDSTADEMDSTLLEYLALSNEPVTPSAWFQENFHAEHQAETLASLMNSVSQSNMKLR